MSGTALVPAALPLSLPVASREILPRVPRFHWLKDIMLPTQPLYLVEGMIPRSGLTFIYGPPGSGKSFLALHLAGCVAMGRPWFGRKCERGAVLFLAFEGGPGIRARLVALKIHDPALGNAPIALIDELMPLRGSELDFQALLCAIDAMRRELEGSGLELRLIVIDTYARAMGDADENSSADMGEMLNIVETIRRVSGAAVVAIAHPGKNHSNGMRGHSKNLGACDAAWEVKALGDGRRYLGCVKNKDGPSDLAFCFELEQLRLDREGRLTSCRVVECGVQQSGSGNAITNATDRLIIQQMIALRETHGEPRGEWCTGAALGFALKRKDLTAALRALKPDRATVTSWTKQLGRRLEALRCAGHTAEAEDDGDRWIWITQATVETLGLGAHGRDTHPTLSEGGWVSPGSAGLGG